MGSISGGLLEQFGDKFLGVSRNNAIVRITGGDEAIFRRGLEATITLQMSTASPVYNHVVAIVAADGLVSVESNGGHPISCR